MIMIKIKIKIILILTNLPDTLKHWNYAGIFTKHCGTCTCMQRNMLAFVVSERSLEACVRAWQGDSDSPNAAVMSLLLVPSMPAACHEVFHTSSSDCHA
jgi:hypothetical protein